MKLLKTGFVTNDNWWYAPGFHHIRLLVYGEGFKLVHSMLLEPN